MSNPTAAPDCPVTCPCCGSHRTVVRYSPNRHDFCFDCRCSWENSKRAAAPSPAVGDGRQLVPKVATAAMLKSGRDEYSKYVSGIPGMDLRVWDEGLGLAYQAMLTAAPAPPPAAPLDGFDSGWNAALRQAENACRNQKRHPEAGEPYEQFNLACSLCIDAVKSLNPNGAPLDEAAERYRWLRSQNWNDAPLCVVVRPKEAVKLGSDCPSGDRLDAMIDAERKRK